MPRTWFTKSCALFRSGLARVRSPSSTLYSGERGAGVTKHNLESALIFANTGVRKQTPKNGPSEKTDATGTSHSRFLFKHHNLWRDHGTTGTMCPLQAPAVFQIIQRRVLSPPICLRTPLGEGEQFQCSCCPLAPHCFGGGQLSSPRLDMLHPRLRPAPGLRSVCPLSPTDASAASLFIAPSAWIEERMLP